MIADLLIYSNDKWDGLHLLREQPADYQLLIFFGERNKLLSPDVIPQISEIFINAKIVSASSAGEIANKKLYLESVICCAIKFNNTTFQIEQDNIANHANAYELGESLASKLVQDNLRYIMILSDGNVVNGDDLALGINKHIKPHVEISGVMAGDGTRFEKTITGVGTVSSEGNVILIGFYGNNIQVSTAIRGGWSAFGPDRIITKSNGNEVFEIDNENALSLYKRYLGPFAEELPSSALLFPMALFKDNREEYIVRTILSVNEENGSMKFAGNMPEGSHIRLMRTNTERIIAIAGNTAYEAIKKNQNNAQLALIFNCIGRRLVLDKRAYEEIESIISNFAPCTTVAGLYSYGEFARFSETDNFYCELHNQTLVVTVINEY